MPTYVKISDIPIARAALATDKMEVQATGAGASAQVTAQSVADLYVPSTTLTGAVTGSGSGNILTTLAVPNVYITSPFYPGLPTASALLVRVPVALAFTFAANFAGSYGVSSVAATASTAYNITKNGSTIGTATFALGATTATFTSAGGTTQSLAAGDIIAIVAPASPDATLADPGFALAGTR